MGSAWSAPPGKADVPSGLLPFTVWTKQDLQMMRKRHAVSLGGVFALKHEHFARLLAVNRATANVLFDDIFDTDCNGLVDAFETMCAMALLCSASLTDKVDFAHSLFDFNCQGDLSLAEVTILLRTALLACQKLDNRVVVPSTDLLEGICRIMFDQAGIDYESDLPKHHFDAYAFRDPQITAFLQLWSGSINQALIPEGTQWEDPDFPADDSSLYRRPGIVPPGIPPPSGVQWLRPSVFAKGDQTVLFVGDVPGDGPMVAGQLADQWLLSAMGILTGRPQLLRSLFLPTGQEGLGRYCVRIFKEADWTNEFVDTRVPCDSAGNVLFCRGEERHELWGLLLEKAFAKAHGCYENIMHGDVAEALRDLTGGIVEHLQWMMTATTSQSDPTPSSLESSRHAKVSPSALEGRVRIGETEGVSGSGVVGGWRARGEKQRARMAGWGLAAGSTRPYGWIFDEVVARLAEGQVIGCSRQVWLRAPWESDDNDQGGEASNTGGGQNDASVTSGAPSNGKPFPPSNRVMRRLRSGVSYCVLEAFEKGGTRLLRVKDPWSCGQYPGAAEQTVGDYSGDWGPSSPLWSKHPTLASELLPRTSPGTFWMDQEAFSEIFNTLYAVDSLGVGEPPKDQKRTLVLKKKMERHAASEKGADKLEGRLEGSWEGEGCGGRFSGGKGWLHGTQAFLTIDPAGTVTSSTANKTSRGLLPSAHGGPEEDARVSITVTQEDSRYHGRDYTGRDERHRTIGFLIHTHKWSLESKRDIPKLTKITQKEIKHLTRPFLPRRDVSCRIALPPGQYAIVPTTLEACMPGRFWVHVKADRNFTLQSSASGAAITGSSAGSCDFKLEETGLAVDLVFNEAEEDANGKGLTAIAASVGALWASAHELAAQKALIENRLRGDGEARPTYPDRAYTNEENTGHGSGKVVDGNSAITSGNDNA